MKRTLLMLLCLSLAMVAYAQQIRWTDAEDLTLYGKVTENTFQRYGRLPQSFEGTHIWGLGQQSAGLYVKFRTDADAVTLRWTPLNHSHLDNVVGIASTGLDLYILTDSWQFCGAGRVSGNEQSTTKIDCDYLPSGENEFMLYLPTYDGIKQLEIGVPENATFSDSKLASPRTDKAVIVYGSSIVQGASPSRAGLAGTNVMSRMLDRMVINLGFSGNAHLDPEVALLMASYPDPGAFVLDNVPNCSDKMINERQEQFFRILRDAHPEVPIIFVEECQRFMGPFGSRSLLKRRNANIAFRNIYQKLLASGEKNVYFVEGDAQLNFDLENTPDAGHYNDAAFQAYADLVCAQLEKASLELAVKPFKSCRNIKPHCVLELKHGEGNSRNSEGDFIRLNDGRILFAYSKFVGGNGDDHDACVIAARTSEDDGESWSDDKIVAQNTVEPGGNVMSVSLLRLDEKKIAMFYLRKINGVTSPIATQIIMKVTSNDGKTWDKEIDVTKNFPLAYRVVNNSRIIRLKSGRVLIPVAEHPIRQGSYSSNENRGILYCYYSDDNCKTWKQSDTHEVRDYDGSLVITQEPGLIELNDGAVLMYIRTYSGSQWYSYSFDGGVSWGGDEKSMLKSPVSPATMLRMNNGEILCIWNNHEGREELTSIWNGYGLRTPLTIGLSFDEAQSWKFVSNIEEGFDKDDYHHYWYCYIAAMELEDSILLSYCAENGLRDCRIVKVPKSSLKRMR